MKYLSEWATFLREKNVLYVNSLAKRIEKNKWLSGKALALAEKVITAKPLAKDNLSSDRRIADLLCVLLVWLALASVIFYFIKGVYSSDKPFEVLTTFATALAAFSAASAAISAQRSNDKNEKKNQQDAFDRRFTLLLEQHNRQLTLVLSYLESQQGKRFNNLNALTENGKLCTAGEVTDLIRGHIVFSPYMRVLYHLLKGIADNFSPGDRFSYAKPEEKSYSNIVRSLIPDNVLQLISINTLFFYSENVGKLSLRKDINEIIYNDYHKYFALLRRYDFFAHMTSPAVDLTITDAVLAANPLLSGNSRKAIFFNQGQAAYNNQLFIVNDGLKSDNLKWINYDITLLLKELRVSDAIAFYNGWSFATKGHSLFQSVEQKFIGELVTCPTKNADDNRSFYTVSPDYFLRCFANGEMVKALSSGAIKRQ